MKFFFLLFIFGIILSGCSSSNETRGSIPENPNSPNGLCKKAPTNLKSAGFENKEALERYLAENKIEQLNSISIEYLIQFAFELKRFPSNINSYLVKLGIGFRVLQGKGVAEDPTFDGGESTPDGRSWSTVPGSGGNPTRIVANRLYSGHGSANLVLHERAHTLDFEGTSTHPSIFSTDNEWLELMNTEKSFMTELQFYCGDYCTKNPAEAFAEGFAMYFSCEESRTVVESSPKVLDFFKKFEDGGAFAIYPITEKDRTDLN